nr:MAG TPA: hypothetical protein [Bacteriophage sp.]
MSRLTQLPYWSIYFNNAPNCEFFRLCKRCRNNARGGHEEMAILTALNWISHPNDRHNFHPYLSTTSTNK